MRLFLLLCFFAGVFLPSCSGFSAGGLPEQELKQALAAGDFSFAAAVSPAEARTAAGTAPEKTLLTALHLLRAGERGTSRAAGVLLEALAGFSRDDAGRLCAADTRLVQKIPVLPRTAALFLLCRMAGEFAADSGTLSAPDTAGLRTACSLLLHTLEGGADTDFSRFRGFPEAKDAVENALLRLAPPAPVSPEKEILEIRKLLSDRHYDAAADLVFLLADVWFPENGQFPGNQSPSPDFLTGSFGSREVLSAFGRALLYSGGNASAGADVLERMGHMLIPAAEQADAARLPEIRYMLAFYLARISWLIPGGQGEAFRWMERALADAPSDADRDFSLWYLFDMARARGDGYLLALLEERLREWRGPAVFADILTGLITALAGERDRDSLFRLEAALPDNAPAEIRERLCFLLALLLPADDPGKTERLTALAKSAGQPYYRFRAAELAGLPESGGVFPAQDAESAGDRLSASGEDFPAAFSGQAERLVSLCAAWNLPDLAAVFAREFPFVRADAALAAAETLAETGFPSEAIRLLQAVFPGGASGFSGSSVPGRRVQELLYPDLWAEEVARASEASRNSGEHGEGWLPESLIFAVIRQESLFNPLAVSSAGAKGLMQLMDPTAGEVAAKLDVKSFDLFRPECSIRFGSFYLSEMKRRLSGRIVPALCAYNAGITRVRNWMQDFSFSGGLRSAADECLFLEAVPYEETRNYAKRVLTSMRMYGFLYAE